MTSNGGRQTSRRLLSTQNPKSILGMWLFTTFWCGISFPIFWAFAFQARQFGGAIIGSLFSLIGLALLYATVKMTLEYFKYGRIHLALEGEPARGRAFSARLDLPGDVAVAAMTIHAVLACVRVTWSRGSKGAPSKGEQDEWTGRKVFPVRRSTTGGYATLHFDVPADQPVSDLPEETPADAMLEVSHPAGIEIGRTYYRWELRVKADVPGIDLDRTFKLRVAPGSGGVDARPGIAPVDAASVLRPAPVLAPDLERRIEARRAAERTLSLWCAFVGFAPFLAGFGIAGIAIGLAGCPMGWSASQPPVCEFAGINWGWFMAKGFDAMFVAVPAGFAGSALLYFAGRLWLDRRHQASSFGGAGGLAIGVIVLGFFLYQFWQFARPARTLTNAPVQAQQPPVKPEAVASSARPDPGRASRGAAAAWQDNDEGGLKQSLAAIERDGGADHPAAARAQYQLSVAYERQHKIADQETALLAALAILEKYPAAEVRRVLGTDGGSLDKEIVARRLGDFYWDRRRYDQAYIHFDKAYRYTAEVQVSDFERNRRFARNSAGRMAGACTQRDWAVADQAMQELKERIVNVDAETRRQLEYWIRTGEPRLAARQC